MNMEFRLKKKQKKKNLINKLLKIQMKLAKKAYPKSKYRRDLECLTNSRLN